MTATADPTANTATGAITGRVVQVTGPVVDVEFPRDQVPDLLNALSLEVDLSGDHRKAASGIARARRNLRLAFDSYTIYTEDKDMKCDGYQNSGVTMESYTGNDKDRYYGRIEEIWELSYAGEKVPMFRVRWAKSVLKEDRYFTTMVIPEASPRKMSHGYWLPKWTNASSLPTRQIPVVLS